MINRFNKLYSLNNNLYEPEFPIIVRAGVLLKDKETNSVVAQMKFQSISDRTIQGLKISLATYDISNEPLGLIEDYQYLDLNIMKGQSFGTDKAIIIPNEKCRKFDIEKLIVIFKDGSTIECKMNSFKMLSENQELSTCLSLEQIKQYKINVYDRATYLPVDETDIWLCTCGTYATDDVCPICKSRKANVFENIKLNILTESINARRAEEQAKQKIAYENELIEKKKKKKKKRS